MSAFGLGDISKVYREKALPAPDPGLRYLGCVVAICGGLLEDARMTPHPCSSLSYEPTGDFKQDHSTRETAQCCKRDTQRAT